MSDMPKGWTTIRLGEAGEWRGGGTPSKSDPSFWADGTIPWVSPKDIKRDYVSDAEEYITDAAVAGSATQLVPANSIVIVARSGILKHTLPVAITTREVAINQDLKALSPISAIDVDYLLYHLKADAQAVLQHSAKSGTTVESLDFNRLKSYDLRLPPLAEQKRIVAKVKSLAARSARARAELSRVPALLARYKQRLLALAASGELTRDWRAAHSAEGPKVASVAEVAEAIFDGPFGSNLKSSDYTDEGIRVIRLENIGHLQFIREKESFVSAEKFESLKRHLLKPNDLLFSSFVADEIRVCLFPENLRTAAINKADCFCVRLDQSICLPQYLAFRLAAPTTFERLKNDVHGATRPRISLSQLRALKLNLPPLEEQAEIVRRLESAFVWLDRMAKDEARGSGLLVALEAAILVKAFRGQLIPSNPHDEPAADLLRRVQAEQQARPIAIRPRGHRKTKVNPIMTRSLADVLREAGDWLPAQEAFRRCGVTDGSPTELIESLYSELRALDKANALAVQVVTDQTGRKVYDQLKAAGL